MKLESNPNYFLSILFTSLSMVSALNRPGILTSLAPCTSLPSCLSVNRRGRVYALLVNFWNPLACFLEISVHHSAPQLDSFQFESHACSFYHCIQMLQIIPHIILQTCGLSAVVYCTYLFIMECLQSYSFYWLEWTFGNFLIFFDSSASRLQGL